MGKSILKYGKATCPHCLNSYDLKALERQTEYGCWSSEEEQVECPDCEEAFSIRCENRGWEPANDHFDFDGWLNSWGLQVPPEHRIFVEHYLLRALEGEGLRLVTMDDERYLESNPKWAEAFEIAKPLWESFLGKKERKELE